MLRRRVIPCLDVANGRVVKGTRFVDLIDEGDPPELAERYAQEGADELVFLDITAAPEGRGHAARHRRADGAAGVHPADGRWRRPERRRDARRAAGRRRQGGPEHARPSPIPALVTACAARFGSQAVVVAIDARRSRRSTRPTRRASRSSSRAAASRPGSTPIEWADRAVELGAGELLVTSIDRDGTKSGFDTELLRAITIARPRAGHRVGRRVRARATSSRPSRRRRRRRARRVHLPPPRGLDRRGQGGDGRGRASRSACDAGGAA